MRRDRKSLDAHRAKDRENKSLREQKANTAKGQVVQNSSLGFPVEGEELEAVRKRNCKAGGTGEEIQLTQLTGGATALSNNEST